MQRIDRKKQERQSRTPYLESQIFWEADEPVLVNDEGLARDTLSQLPLSANFYSALHETILGGHTNLLLQETIDRRSIILS